MRLQLHWLIFFLSSRFLCFPMSLSKGKPCVLLLFGQVCVRFLTDTRSGPRLDVIPLNAVSYHLSLAAFHLEAAQKPRAGFRPNSQNQTFWGKTVTTQRGPAVICTIHSFTEKFKTVKVQQFKLPEFDRRRLNSRTMWDVRSQRPLRCLITTQWAALWDWLTQCLHSRPNIPSHHRLSLYVLYTRMGLMEFMHPLIFVRTGATENGVEPDQFSPLTPSEISCETIFAFLSEFLRRQCCPSV